MAVSFTLGAAGSPATPDPRKRLLGLVPQELALYEELTAADNLNFFGALYDCTGQLSPGGGDGAEAVGLADRASD
jgi:ABC-2 type transport system ATP-binding protein